jgi:hypothetical protein
MPSSGEPSRTVSRGASAVSSPLLSVLVNREVVGEVTAERRQQMELLAGTGTAVLLFLVVIGTLAWRCRRHSLTSSSSTIRSKKLVEDVPICRAGKYPDSLLLIGEKLLPHLAYYFRIAVKSHFFKCRITSILSVR